MVARRLRRLATRGGRSRSRPARDCAARRRAAHRGRRAVRYDEGEGVGGLSTLADPIPGGRAKEAEHASALAGEFAGRGAHGVVLSWVDPAGVNRVKSIALGRLPDAVRWGIGMSPVFDTFLADDSIVRTDVLGGPDGDLRLYPDLDELVVLAAQPGWAWVTGGPRGGGRRVPLPGE